MRKSVQERAELRQQTEANCLVDKDRSAHADARGQKTPGSSRSSSSKASLSRRDLDDSELEDAINEFHSGSDRVAAIMGSALVENHLVEGIRSCLDDASNEAALFHEVTAPFSTFGAKITAGRALGLYNKQVEDDLNRIRKIRNDFAHALLSINFENKAIIGICDGLADYVYHGEGQRQGNANPSRLKFERACWTISLGLLLRANKNVQKKNVDLRSLLDNALSNEWNIADLNSLVATYLKSPHDNIESQIRAEK